MKEFLKEVIEWGPLGVFLLSALDSAGIPLPSMVDALIVAVVLHSPGLGMLTLAGAIVGSLAGNVVLYTIARKGGQAYLDRLTSGRRGQRFRRWFDEYGLITVFVPAVSVIPMPLKAFVACAAVLGVPMLRFLRVIAVARMVRYGFVTWLALSFDFQDFEEIKGFATQNALWFILGAVALGVGFYFVSRAIFRPKSEVSAQQPGR
ncbi:MAG: VTT domain-containing protein [Bryobacterales bacterium]|nr:VTT domain-containing protein [Bryobacterales bacterium]